MSKLDKLLEAAEKGQFLSTTDLDDADRGVVQLPKSQVELNKFKKATSYDGSSGSKPLKSETTVMFSNQQNNKLNKRRDDLNDEYGDGVLGAWKSNKTLGRINQDVNAAYSRYLANPTAENKAYAERLSKMAQDFQEKHKDSLEEEGKLALWVSDIASYVPQGVDQLKAQAAGAAAGAAAGSVIPGVGTAIGFKVGAVAATGIQSYKQMQGAAFRELIAAGVDEETAKQACKDEAFISSLIEMGGTVFDLFTLGTGKAITALLGKEAVEKAAKTGLSKSVKTLAKTLSKYTDKFAVGYALNVLGEGMEESSQQAVSIANLERAQRGETGKGLAREAISTARDAFTGDSEEDIANRTEIVEAGKTGMRIAAITGGVTKVGSTVTTKVAENQYNKTAGRQVNGISGYDKIKEGLTFSPDSETYKKATKLDQKIKSKGVESVTDAEYGALVNAMASDRARGLGTATETAQPTSAQTTPNTNTEQQTRAAEKVRSTVQQAAAQEAATPVQAEAVQAQAEANGERVSMSSTQTFMAAGDDAKTADRKAQVLERMRMGEEVTDTQLRKMDIGSASTRAVIEAVTGMQVPQTTDTKTLLQFGRELEAHFAIERAQREAAQAEAASMEAQITQAEQWLQEQAAQAEQTVRAHEAQRAAEIQETADAQAADVVAQISAEADRMAREAETPEQAASQPGGGGTVRLSDGTHVTQQEFISRYLAANPGKTEVDAHRCFVDAKIRNDLGDAYPADGLAKTGSAESVDLGRYPNPDKVVNGESGSQKTDVGDVIKPARQSTESRQREDAGAEKRSSVDKSASQKQGGPEAVKTATTGRSTEVQRWTVEHLNNILSKRKGAPKVVLDFDITDGSSGHYDADTNTIHLNGSKLTTQQQLTYTLGHELVHSVHDAKARHDLVDTLLEFGNSIYGVGGMAEKTAETWDTYVAFYTKKKGLSLEEAKSKLANEDDGYFFKEELAANIMRDVLTKPDVMRTFAQEQPTPAQWLRDKANDIVNGLIKRVTKADETTWDIIKQARKIADTLGEGISEAEKKTDAAPTERAESAPARENVPVGEEGASYEVDGKRHSIRSLTHDVAEGKMFDDLVSAGVFTEEEAGLLKENLTKLIEYMVPNASILDMNEAYDKGNRPFSAYKPNSDPLYKISLDFSTLCRKRLMTQYVIEQLQLRENRPMSAEEQIAIRSMLMDYREKEKALQVACAMCYVEAARLKSPKQMEAWFNNTEALMRKYFSKKNGDYAADVKKAQEQFKIDHGYEANAPKKAMSQADRKAMDAMSLEMRKAYAPTAEQQAIIDAAVKLPRSTYLTAANLTALSVNHPEIYEAYTEHIRASTRSKSLEGDVPYYYGDSKGPVSDKFIEGVNAENGMRFDSWSDFQMKHMLDMITAVIDLSVRGAKMHGYTKFPEMVRIFGKTGMQFNLSGVTEGTGLDENGELIFSATESINKDEAIKLREDFPETAGLQCIGVNEAHIRALLRSDIIDYVIPYHTSGMNATLRKMAGIYNWQDYTSTQHATKDPGAKKTAGAEKWQVEPVWSEFYVAEGKDGYDIMQKTAQRYIGMCHERGLIPKFNEFTNEDGYWKLLVDRKMINQKTGAIIEQQPVKPIFDFDLIRQEIDREVKQYDPQLEQRALKHVVGNFDAVHQRIDDLKKNGPKKSMATLGNEVLQAYAEGSTRTATEKRHSADDYSYDALVSKPDIVVTTVPIREIPTKGKRLDMSQIASEGRQKSNTQAVDGRVQHYVYIKDLGANTLLPKAGMIHGLTGNKTNSSARSTAEVTYELPAILENSVAVNERNPRTADDGEFGYLLFGYAVREDGQEYVVKSTVNHFADNRSVVDNVEIYDVLKGSKAKKVGSEEPTYGESTHRGATPETRRPVALRPQPRTISVAELLAIVKDNYPELLPDSVREYFGITEAPKEAGLRYSVDDDSYAPVFYSKMEQVVNDVKQAKLGASSVVSMLRGKGVKAEEIKWSGIETWLEGKKSVTKDELLEFIRNNELQIEEKLLEDSDKVTFTAVQQRRVDGYRKLREEAITEIDELLKDGPLDIAAEWQASKDLAASPMGEGQITRADFNMLRNAALDYNQEQLQQLKEREPSNNDLKLFSMKNDDFGFDYWSDAVRAIRSDPERFARNYDMSEADKQFLLDYARIKANNAKVAREWTESAETQKVNEIIALAEDAIDAFSAEARVTEDAKRKGRQTHWKSYSTDGGKNYRELLFRLPGSDYYNDAMEAHWQEDAQGILAHARIQDFETAEGKMLFIDEIQSDWHNAGHKNGYRETPRSAKLENSQVKLEDGRYVLYVGGVRTDQDVGADFLARRFPNGITDQQIHEGLLNGYNRNSPYDGRVPDAPFHETYHEFVLKRLLRMAAEGGYDSLGWTTAKMQMDRWSEEFAEGYRIEYDQDIPRFLNKYGKKWGAQVGNTYLDNLGYNKSDVQEREAELRTALEAAEEQAENMNLDEVDIDDFLRNQRTVARIKENLEHLKGTKVWYIPITEAMRESVLYEGQPRYSVDSVDGDSGADINPDTGYERGSLEDSAMRIYNVKGRDAAVQALQDYIDAINKIAEEHNKKVRDGKAAEVLNPKLTQERIESNSRKIEALIKKFGEMEQTSGAQQEVHLPKKIDPNTKVRGAVQTEMAHAATTEPVANQLVADILAGKAGVTYTPITDNEVLKNIRKQIKSRKGFEEIRSEWNDLIKSGKLPSKQDIAKGEALYVQACAEKRVAEAVQIAAEIAVMGTKAGQAVQAFSLLKRMTPTGKAYYLKRTVDSLNRDKLLDKKGIKLTLDKTMVETLLTAKTAEEVKAAEDAIIEDLANQIPATFADKVNLWRYTAMLTNPRTHIRNVLGNTLFAPLRKTKDSLATLMEHLIIKDESQRTKSVTISKEWRDFAKQDAELMKEELQGGGRYELKDRILDKRQTFGNADLAKTAPGKLLSKTLGKATEKVSKANTALMEKEDWGLFGLPGLRSAYVSALGGFLQARGFTVDQVYGENSTPEGRAALDAARAYAMKEAQKATYRDASRLAGLLGYVNRNSGGVGKVLMGGVLPFTKTPINIARRAIDYSPVGILKSVTTDLYKLSKNEMSAAEVIDDLCAGLTGTGVFLMGYFLAKTGVLIGGLGDDEEDKFKELQGYQDYSFNWDDKNYTIDWASPVAMPLFVGAEWHKLMQQRGNGLSFWDWADASMGLLDPLLAMSMMSGLNDTLSAVSYNRDAEPIPAIVEAIVASYMGQFVPSALGAAARTIDDSRRTNFTPTGQKGLEKQINIWYQTNILGKTPFLSDERMLYIDEWGRTDTDGGIVMRGIANFLSPGYGNTISTSPLEEELSRLAEVTKNKSVYPGKAQKSFTVNKETYAMTQDEYQAHLIECGQTSYRLASDIIHSPGYERLSEAEKAVAINLAYTYAAETAKYHTNENYNRKDWQFEMDDYVAKGGDAAEFLMIMARKEETKIAMSRLAMRDPQYTAGDVANLLLAEESATKSFTDPYTKGHEYILNEKQQKRYNETLLRNIDSGYAELLQSENISGLSDDELDSLVREMLTEARAATKEEMSDWLWDQGIEPTKKSS